MKHDRTIALLQQPGNHLRYLQPAARTGGGPAWLTEADADTWQQLLSARFPGYEFAAVPARFNCSYCNCPAEPYAEPPVCQAHLDLTIMVQLMVRRNIRLTLDNALVLLASTPYARWRLTQDDLTALWPAFIQKRQELINGR